MPPNTLETCRLEEWQGRYSLIFWITQQRRVPDAPPRAWPRRRGAGASPTPPEPPGSAEAVASSRSDRQIARVRRSGVTLLCLWPATARGTESSAPERDRQGDNEVAQADGTRSAGAALGHERPVRLSRCLPTTFRDVWCAAGRPTLSSPCHRALIAAIPDAESARSPDEESLQGFPAPWCSCRRGAPPRLSTC